MSPSVQRHGLIFTAATLFAGALVFGDDPAIRIPCLILMGMCGITDRIVFYRIATLEIIHRCRVLVRSGCHLTDHEDQ